VRHPDLTLPVRIRLDQTAIDGELFAAELAFFMPRSNTASNKAPKRIYCSMRAP
jgi:hypothetical protein